MIKAVLIDLDDTLLQSNMDRFLPAYLKRLSNALADYDDPEDIITNLYRSTQRMIDNLDPTRTLKQAFDGRFYPALGASEEELREEIDSFYQQVFPQLRELTTAVPVAQEFVAELASDGYQLVIATNPLFPRTAIAQRLEWAGIDPDSDQIQLITSYEQFHFAKPNPAYYAEILGWLGIAAEEAVMIGDDPINDLAPAEALGMRTFKVSLGSHSDEQEMDLRAAAQWIKAQAGEQRRSAPATRDALLARLRGDLAALLQRANDLSQEAWRANPSKRGWSPLEILCHLRDTEREVNYPRLHKLLVEETPFLSAANPDEWANERNYLGQDPSQALGEFSDTRRQTIARLAELDDETWQKPARHALLGPTTLAEVMMVVVDHDLLHLRQLRETLSAVQ